MSHHVAQVSDRADLIPGVYDYCDQWCSYCPFSARCLAHLVACEREARRGDGSVFRDVSDAVAFTRVLAKAAGASTAELDAIVSGDAAHEYSISVADRSIQQRAERCAAEASLFLRTAGWRGPARERLRPQPPPLDVFAWYHVFLVTKTCRALIAIARADRGCPGASADAKGSAKVVLTGIDRSRAALGQLARDSNRTAVQRLVNALDGLASMLEARIPGARAFLRPGLDTRAD